MGRPHTPGSVRIQLLPMPILKGIAFCINVGIPTSEKSWIRHCIYTGNLDNDSILIEMAGTWNTANMQIGSTEERYLK